MSDEISRPGPSIGLVAAILGGFGCFMGLWQLLAFSDVVSNPIANDVHSRLNDFLNYGRQRASGGLENLHPVYALLVENNVTLPAFLSEYLIEVTGGEHWPRLLLSMAYAGLLGLGVPLLVYAFTRKVALAVAVVFLMCVLASNERIYSYGLGYTTGHAGASLFLLTLALIVFGRFKTAGLTWLLHLWVHPTTAVMWSMLLFSIALLRFLEKSARAPIGPRQIYAFCIFAPLAIGLVMVAAEYSELMMKGVPREEYWAIIRAATYHTIFLGVDRYYLVVAFISQAAALVILGAAADVPKPLRQVNLAAGCFGAGALIFSVSLVETEASVLAAATLPMRFAVVMYGLLLVNLVQIAALGKRSDSRLLAGVILLSMLAGHLHLLVSRNFNPLMPIWIWAVVHWHFVMNKGLGRAVPWIVAGLFVQVVLLTTLPSSPAEWHPTGPMRAVEGLVRALPIPDRNVVHTVVALLGAIAVIAAATVVSLIANHRLLVRAAWVGVAAFALIASVRAVDQRFPFSPAVQEVLAIAEGRNEANATTELRAWMAENVPPDVPVLGDPNTMIRRVLKHSVSVDFDLLSLVPYVPLISGDVAREFKRDYGIDFASFARQGFFVRSAVVDADRWVAARDKALAGELPYSLVVERTYRPRSDREPVFENEIYRVYRRP